MSDKEEAEQLRNCRKQRARLNASMDERHKSETKSCWRLKASPAAGTLIAAKNEVADVTAVALDGKSFPDDLRFPGLCFRSKAPTVSGRPQGDGTRSQAC